MSFASLLLDYSIIENQKIQYSLTVNFTNSINYKVHMYIKLDLDKIRFI